MAQRQKGQKIYTTMQGKQIDMDLLRKKNELTPAVGNARVNARGDELGPGGKIIKKREDVVKEYYNNQSRPVADEPTTLRKPAQETKVAEETVTKPKTTSRKTTRAQEKVEEAAKPTAAELEEFEEMDAEWVEDADGNFVKKGE
jgi:hypothetical protein